MADEINVNVIRRKARRFLYLRYECPITGERIERSSGAETEKEAGRRAAEWQAELRAGGGGRNTATWEEFRNRYELGKAFTLRETTIVKICNTFNVIESVMKPDHVRRITPQWISTFQKRLIDSGRSQATVASHCRHLKAALNWAKEQGVISNVPKFPKLNKVRSAKQMKGRPVTLEEFDRMIQAIPGALSKKSGGDSSKRRTESLDRQAKSFDFLLRGTLAFWSETWGGTQSDVGYVG